MGQEFTINSTQLEDKMNQLFPSQGGFGAGVDLSASTQIIPVVNLTESAEGSNLREDLQSSFSLGTIETFEVLNATSTIVNTTGYYRIFGGSNILANSGSNNNFIRLTDGVTTKIVYTHLLLNTAGVTAQYSDFDFIVKLGAGESITVESGANTCPIFGVTRQIADLSGNLVTP